MKRDHRVCPIYIISSVHKNKSSSVRSGAENGESGSHEIDAKDISTRKHLYFHSILIKHRFQLNIYIFFFSSDQTNLLSLITMGLGAKRP